MFENMPFFRPFVFCCYPHSRVVVLYVVDTVYVFSLPAHRTYCFLFEHFHEQLLMSCGFVHSGTLQDFFLHR